MEGIDKRSRNSEILSLLIEKAAVQGYINSDDLFELNPNLVHDSERTLSLLKSLKRSGVEVLDTQKEDDLGDEDENSSDLDPFSSLDPISSDDTIGLYLKEMARVPLLNMEEELEIAQRIERGKQACQRLEKLNGHDPALRVKLGEQVRMG
ncbi:MAG: sigma-70 factor domain-containing protein, partial [Anaerolineaceae bacterium]